MKRLPLKKLVMILKAENANPDIGEFKAAKTADLNDLGVLDAKLKEGWRGHFITGIGTSYTVKKARLCTRTEKAKLLKKFFRAPWGDFKLQPEDFA